MCTFGSKSSAGIFDDLAKVVKDLVCIKSRIDDRMVNQVLDDAVACDMEGDGSVFSFYKAYREIGMKLVYLWQRSQTRTRLLVQPILERCWGSCLILEGGFGGYLRTSFSL